MQIARLFFVMFLTVGITHIAASQTQIIINASKDNTLYESATGAFSNGIGEYFFVGRTAQPAGSSIRRGLLAFDVAGNIPTGSTITSVTLTLSMSRTISGAHTVSLHHALAYWGEGTSNAGGNEGGGAPATIDDGTWLHRFFDTVFWSSTGGDFSPTPSASHMISSIGVYTWESTTQMVADVQHWLDNPSDNHGWVILGNETVAPTAKRFGTRENAIAGARPRLSVNFVLTGVDEMEEVPNQFTLEQNYPNPFNPSTTIRFALPKSAYVTLKVFNLVGQEVATLVDGEKLAGEYALEWRAGGLTSGVYFYRLQASEFISSKKLILLK